MAGFVNFPQATMATVPDLLPRNIMGNYVHRTLGVLLGGALALWAMGKPQLHLDGILIVKGASVEGSRVIVLGSDGETRVLDDGLAHFTFSLELQKEYLVSFERPGFVSKKLRFNTKVPVGALTLEGFRFPFQVTLEAPPDGQHMEYAGPVGYIDYDGGIGDFGYSTDYRMLKEDFLAEELAHVHSALRERSGPAAPGMLRPAIAESTGGSAEPAAPAAMPSANLKPRHPNEILAPRVSRVPPMVHVLAAPPLAAPAAPVPHVPLPPEETVKVAERRAPVPEAGNNQSGFEELALAQGNGIEKEVLADGLRVITIIRKQEGPRTEEFRKVVSYYGGTTYFCRGYACSADTFEREISR